MNDIVPNPYASEEAFERFWNRDLSGRDDAAFLEAELYCLRHEEALHVFQKTNRMIWSDPDVSRVDWLRGRQTAIRRHLSRLQRRAA